jgi:hypothetical protein
MSFYGFKHSYRRIVNLSDEQVHLYRSFETRRGCFQNSRKIAFGERWAVALEIFWKARGDHLLFTGAAIACVFKKFTG